jgi:2'-5' RNA ligase
MFFSIATILNNDDCQRIMDINPSIHEMIQDYRNPQDFFHFSWLVCEEMNTEKTINCLKNLCGQKLVFTVQSGGIGIFPGKTPAITYVLVRNPVMTEIHSLIWGNCEKHLGKINMKYAPTRWLPHITLLHQRMEPRRYYEFVEKCIENDVSFEIKVSNLSVIFKDESSAGMLFTCNLK